MKWYDDNHPQANHETDISLLEISDQLKNDLQVLKDRFEPFHEPTTEWCIQQYRLAVRLSKELNEPIEIYSRYVRNLRKIISNFTVYWLIIGGNIAS